MLIVLFASSMSRIVHVSQKLSQRFLIKRDMGTIWSRQFLQSERPIRRQSVEVFAGFLWVAMPQAPSIFVPLR